jgi:hypothetical protein
MALIVVDDKAKSVAQFQFKPRTYADRRFRSIQIYVLGLFEYIQEGYLLIDKAVNGSLGELTSSGIFARESFHAIQLFFRQHAHCKVVAQNARFEVMQARRRRYPQALLQFTQIIVTV